jgi:hypothetical protein
MYTLGWEEESGMKWLEIFEARVVKYDSIPTSQH